LFYESTIYINQRFTYNEAHKDLTRKSSVLKLFNDIALELIKKRYSNGRIDLAISESIIDVNRKGAIESNPIKRLNSHRLIEEFMLSANMCAANFLKEKKLFSVYRAHEPIAEDNIEKINSFLKLFGVKNQLKTVDHHELQNLLKSVEGSESETLLNYMILRTFTQAYYSVKPLGHWALAFGDYTHFTSPIRRISDLVVHREIKSILYKKETYNNNQLIEITQNASKQERIAQEAERAMKKLHLIRILKNFIGTTYHAIFTGFNNYGLFIKLVKNDIEGFVSLKSFSRESKMTAVGSFQVVIPKFSKTITLGQKLEVVLIKCDWENIQIEFEISKFNDE